MNDAPPHNPGCQTRLLALAAALITAVAVAVAGCTPAACPAGQHGPSAGQTPPPGCTP